MQPWSLTVLLKLCCWMLFFPDKPLFHPLQNKLAGCTKAKYLNTPQCRTREMGAGCDYRCETEKRRTLFFLFWVQKISLCAEIGLQSFDLHSELTINVWLSKSDIQEDKSPHAERTAVIRKQENEGINHVTLKDPSQQGADGNINLHGSSLSSLSSLSVGKLW